MQDIAGRHADDLGIGMEFLQSKGLAWVLVRTRVRLERYPCNGELVRIQTWPYGWRRLMAIREFSFDREASDSPCGAATTAWVLFDISRWRPVRPRDRCNIRRWRELHQCRSLRSAIRGTQ